MINPRRAKQLIAPFIPERWKAPLRGRLFGFRPPAAGLPVEPGIDARGPRITIDGRVQLRFREQDRFDIRYQFFDNGGAVDEIASFIRLASPAGTLFDVGASKGVFSQIFCLLDPAKRAISFEPSPAAMADARALAELNRCESRITFRQTAVGRESGRSAGHVSPGGFASIEDARPGRTVQEFEMTSLDDEVAALGVAPDLLKIDVEGYEYEVLLGARKLLRRKKPALCLELHLNLLEERGVHAWDVLRELQSHGYTFRTCSGAEVSPTRIANSINVILRLVAT